eukprot:7699969-Karenia_brevis.AAC.1
MQEHWPLCLRYCGVMPLYHPTFAILGLDVSDGDDEGEAQAQLRSDACQLVDSRDYELFENGRVV